MTNTSGFTTITPLALERTCFTDEQDRLNAYAKALRVPIQVGQMIKGDPGAAGERGPRGDQGPKGDKGDTPALDSTEYPIGSGVSVFSIPNTDARSKFLNLLYDDEDNAPVPPIGILCIRFTSAGNTDVYFTGPTPDGLYKLVVSSFS